METSMSRENAIAILKSRLMVIGEEYHTLQVTNVTPYDGKFIVNFKAMTQYHLDEAKQHIINGDYQKAVNCCLTATLRPTDYIPNKGEMCKVYVDTVTTNKGVTGLFVTSVSPLQSVKSKKVSFDFDSLLEDNFTSESFETELDKQPTLVGKATKK